MRIITLLILVLFSAPAFAADIIKLQDGTEFYGYYKSDLPAELQKGNCDVHGFLSDKLEIMSPGKYTSKDGLEFIIEGTCLYPKVGQAELADGKTIEFYQEDTINTNGQMVYQDGVRVMNATLKLKEDNQEFKVVHGYIENWGGYHGGKILYEDRN